MILLTGANGQLGTDFKKILDNKNIEYISTDFEDLDITNIDNVRDFVKGKEISYIINCAAYNNVDKAEEEKEFCYKLNTEAPKNLAIVAKEIGAIFVTYSTDFVFGGEKKSPYTEEDKKNPLCTYAESKSLGEDEVLKTYDKVYVIRTSWVFGMGNNNFNKQVINWSKTRNELNIVDDQVSSPTYSWDLAEYSRDLVKSNQFGLYQLSNDGECSKYDQAKYVLESIGWQGKLGRAKTEDFNLPAKRANYSKISSEKAEKIIGRKMPSWQSGIDRFLLELKGNN